MKVKKVKIPKTSALSKAVNNVKQIIKKKNKEDTQKKDKEDIKKRVKEGIKKRDKEVVKKRNKDIIKKKILKEPSVEEKDEEIPFRSTRGVVYIGHIPYGFFESEMKEYFEQFGKVTRVRVARSKKTGKSRGYGYVEFDSPEVAKIAAETMNNYLMCGRLLKTTYIPPEKQHFGFFAGKPWTTNIYPTLTNRIRELKKNESPLSVRNYRRNVRRSLKELADLEEKLKNEGVHVKFKPVDVPNDKEIL